MMHIKIKNEIALGLLKELERLKLIELQPDLSEQTAQMSFELPTKKWTQ
jgi:hypothetical protein